MLFTLGILAISRAGCHLPTPGVNYGAVKTCLGQVDNNGLYNIVNLVSVGGLLQLSVFALGIMPYIPASIIVQLLTVVIPRFEALKKEGQSGTTKLTQYTSLLTIALAVLQSTSLVGIARSPGALFQNCSAALAPNDTIFVLLVMVIPLTAGTAVI